MQGWFTLAIPQEIESIRKKAPHARLVQHDVSAVRNYRPAATNNLQAAQGLSPDLALFCSAGGNADCSLKR
jgi:hypothetical protein